MSGLKIIFRADAGQAMGTGHVMRCLALAQALGDLGHECHMVSAELPATLAARLAAEGIILHALESRAPAPGADDAEDTLHMVSMLDAAAVVVDGYHFGPDWRRTLYRGCRAGGRVVLALIDDAEGPVDHADLVLNPVAPPRLDLPGCLFGPRFVLLRRDIRAAVSAVPPLSRRRDILISFGGSDPKALTRPVALALASVLRAEGAMPGAVTLSVVVGGAVADADAVAASLEAIGAGVEVHRDVREMGPLMARSGLAVSAGGGTLGELAALAVPTLVVTVADNQLAGAAAAADAGWCVALSGDDAQPLAVARAAQALWQDVARRTAMAERARGLIDGQGAIRVAESVIAAATHGSVH